MFVVTSVAPSMFCCDFLPIFLIVLPAVSGYRILGIFPHNGRSHFAMNEQLMKGLAERGHHVDVVSHFPLAKPFPNYNQIVDLSGTIPDVQNNVSYDMMATLFRSVMGPAVSSYCIVMCDLMGQPSFQKLLKNPPKDPPYDLVVVNMIGATCYMALGQHSNVPIVGTVASAMFPWTNRMVANPDNPAYIPDVFSGLYAPMNFWQRMWNTLHLTLEYFLFDYYTTSRQENTIKQHIGPRAPSLGDAERNISLILTNAHHIINGVRPYTTAVVEVGGLHIPERVDPLPKDLENWLNDSKDGFIYMSFGSMMTIESFPEEILKALYTSVAKLWPVRVLMKITKPEQLPDGLPDNVLTRPWIPQLSVLQHKHVRAFVTHGGLMGIQEAVHCGVPMIGVPLFTDQPQNLRVPLRRGAAVVLDHKKLSVENLDAAFDAVLNDPSYMKEAKKLSAEFRDRPMSPLDTAIFWVEYVIRHGGKNLRSPAMDLTWWQISLIDVYGSLLLVVASAIYLTAFLIKKLVTATTGGTRVASRRDKKLTRAKKFM